MNIKGKNLQLLFYILTAYTLLAFAWWGFLLWQKNDEAFQATIEREIMYFEFQKGLGTEAFYQSEDYQEILLKHRRQQYMITGEGIVLFILLLLGIWRLKTTLYKEVELARRQKNFLLSITHELKSPLASVKLGIETLKRIGTKEEKQEKLLNGCLSETARLEALVNNILLTARLDNNAYNPQIEHINLHSAIQQITDKISTQFKHSHQIEIEIPTNIILHTDQQILHSVCINLLENAHKYSPHGTIIKVFSGIKENQLHLIFKDEGQGISEKEQKRIFEKFYRSGNEETRNTKGTGLGLYIVNNLLKLIHAKIELHSKSGEGTTFSIIFPEKNWEMK